MAEGKKVQGRDVGSVYLAKAEQQRSGNWPGNFAVFRQGDGTLEGDTVCLGLFWNLEKAELFRVAVCEKGEP